MKFGMSQNQFKLLETLVIRPLKSQGAKVYIFGSRAKGKHHPYSDVDLLYDLSEPLPPGFLPKIKEDIEESNFPFAVDLVAKSELSKSYEDSVLSQMQAV